MYSGSYKLARGLKNLTKVKFKFKENFIILYVKDEYEISCQFEIKSNSELKHVARTFSHYVMCEKFLNMIQRHKPRVAIMDYLSEYPLAKLIHCNFVSN